MREGRLQIRLDAKLKKRAERLAQRANMSLSALVVQMLTYAVDGDEEQRRARKVVEAEQV
jgi:predicted HicB family RNase H-like nuclease